MKDPIRPAHRVDVSANSKAVTIVAERRSAARQQFVTEVLIVEISTGVKLSARSCDLAINGCYVDTLRPFSVGTLVRIRLKQGETIVDANGSVVYQLPGLGMGIAFQDLTPESHAALDKWLSHKPVQQESLETLLPLNEPDPPTVIRRKPAAEFVELIQMLKKKGILTGTEAASLLKESLDK